VTCPANRPSRQTAGSPRQNKQLQRNLLALQTDSLDSRDREVRRFLLSLQPT
jgi:hypothetical protein